MATQTNEAKILVTAQDRASAELAKVQARFDSMLAPVRRLQAAMAHPMRLAGVTTVHQQLRGLHSAMQAVPLAGTLFAVGGFGAVTKSLIGNSVAAHDALGKLNDLSKAYKVSGKDLQVYAEVGADSGVAVEDIAKSFGFLQKMIAGARAGNKEDIKTLWGVGINTTDLQGDAASVFNKISDTYKNSIKGSDDALKVDFAKKVFSKSGTNLIPMLEEGGAKYAEIYKKMVAEGRLFTEEQIAQADATGDAWGASMRRIDGLKKHIGLAMAPMLDAMTNSINTLMAGPHRAEIIETFKLLGTTIATEAPKFIRAIPVIVGAVGDLFGAVKKLGSFVGWDKLLFGGVIFLASPFIASTMTMTAALGRVGLSLLAVVARMGIFAGAGVMSVITGVSSMAATMTAFGATSATAWAVALAPVLLVTAAVAGVAAAAYWVYANWGGVSSFFAGVWDGISSSFEPLKPVFTWLGDKLGAVMGWLGELTGFTSNSASGLQDWSQAGRTAGAVVATAIHAILSPLYLAIDAFKLLGASWDWLNGKGFNFESTTAAVGIGLVKSRFADIASKNAVGYDGNSEANPFARHSQNLPSTSINTPSLGMPQIVSSRTEVGGKLDIRIMADGKPQVERVESVNRNVDIDVRAGAMYGVGA